MAEAPQTTPGIDVDTMRRGGRPVLAGTGFTVAQLVAEIAEGQSPDEVAENFSLDTRTVRAALNTVSGWLDTRLRPGAIDTADAVLREYLGSMDATAAAIRVVLALRRAGLLVEVPDAE